MEPINFVVITDTPQRLKDFLLARGIIKEVPDMRGDPMIVGERPGFNWTEIANPIITDPNSVPPTSDTRHVFLIQLSQESAANAVDGATHDGNGMPIDPYDWSKFGKWVKANASPQTAPAAWRVRGEPVGEAWKVNGENVWLIRDRPERFGMFI